ncbi:alpha/beta hydrolase family protein [Gilvimarinus agarilyticus]|uniref:alpha/beta hydrolase family protein n=1 Tax=Gilvimarinus agarilyticus TaxID=679259 RepID=UPI0005A138DC|nr:hypothetical protein [Gilvimarinus agarilyticus]
MPALTRCILVVILVVLVAGCSLVSPVPSSTAKAGLTAEQDHARTLAELGISAVRPGVNGDPSAAVNPVNYDEALANAQMGSLPPLLQPPTANVIASPAEWRAERQRLRSIFAQEFYGEVPERLPEVQWQKSFPTFSLVGATPVRHQRISGVISADDSRSSVAIDMTLTTPAGVSGPVPVVLAFQWDLDIVEHLASRMSQDKRREFYQSITDWQKQVLQAGWGYAEYVPTSVQADTGAGLTTGIIGLANSGAPRSTRDWGALRAWGWGASRALDYLQTEKRVKGEQVVVFGHSRYGKAALVALAFDDRFAGGYISSSGEAGASLWRRNYGEQIGNVAAAGEYHWMAGNFLKYAGPLTVNDLPLDSHQLLALAAPRPIFIGAGYTGDEWVDPKGSYLALRAASEAYHLLGGASLKDTQYPSVGTLLQRGNMAFRQHDQGHTAAPNWGYALEFFNARF